jgi:ribosome biogenesis GTPase / thiamine phosphate phosphatase
LAKKRKIRVDFQKNRQTKRREGDLTRQFRDADEGAADDLGAAGERVRAKGKLSRKRTIIVDEASGFAADERDAKRGRVLSVSGLYCIVVDDSGSSHRCYIRRLLKSMESDERSVVSAGDWVRFRPAPNNEGLVLRVEPRERSLVRRYRGREQVIAANVDQLLIVSALADPAPKLTLIDRWLVRAELSNLRPIICFNKADLVDLAPFQPIFGMYARLGYAVVAVSAETGFNLDELRAQLQCSQTVLLGMSGVGKSSLLNALEPKYQLAVKEVSASSNKGRHTTTTARLLELAEGGSVIDTPGVRQFELAEVDPGELAGAFIEFRPFLSRCRFSSCTHSEQEEGCGVAQAVVDRHIAAARYDAYLRILEGTGDE